MTVGRLGGTAASKSTSPVSRGSARLSTLVLGLGNPILTDDGVGIHVVRLAARCWQYQTPTARTCSAWPERSRSACTERSRSDGITFKEASIGGLRLLDVLKGFDRVVLVDAILTQDGVAGETYRLRVRDLQASLHSGSSHDLSLAGALALGRGLGMSLPDDDDITIIAIQAQDILTFGEQCTPAVALAVPRAAEAILAELHADPLSSLPCLTGTPPVL
jgi:hydrogenase maturation protease